MTEAKKSELINAILDKQFQNGKIDQIHCNGIYVTREEMKSMHEKCTIEEIETFTEKEINKIDEEKQIDKKAFDYIKIKALTEYQLQNKEGASEIITGYLENKYYFKTTKNDEKKEMWIYQQGIYIPNGISTIKEETRKILGETYTTQKVNQIIEKIEADTYIEQEEFFNQQNKHIYLIPIKNGLLNIKTKEISKFTPEKYFFNKINAEYNENNRCPTFLKFVNEIVENPEKDVKILQELFGYCLLKEYRYEKAFMLYGAHGRNGKSKLLTVLKEFLSVENTSDLSLKALEKEGSFLICELHNKLVNISGDLSNEALQNTGMFKSVTGRDSILADRKFKTSLKFVNYAKMVFACNELPPINTTSEAFWLRWVMINFPYQYLPQQDIDSKSEEELKNVRLQDPTLVDKLTTQEELNGVLNWAIAGFERLEQNKDFSSNQTAKKVKIEWTRKSNSVSAFILDHVTEDYEGSIEKRLFKKYYLDYCKKHRIKTVSDKVIKITLENELGATSGNEREFIDGKDIKRYMWEGISFNLGQDGQDGYSFSPNRENPISSLGSKTMSKLSKLSEEPKVTEEFFDYQNEEGA